MWQENVLHMVHRFLESGCQQMLMCFMWIEISANPFFALLLSNYIFIQLNVVQHNSFWAVLINLVHCL